MELTKEEILETCWSALGDLLRAGDMTLRVAYASLLVAFNLLYFKGSLWVWLCIAEDFVDKRRVAEQAPFLTQVWQGFTITTRVLVIVMGILSLALDK